MTAHTADEALDHAHRAWFGRLVGWLFRLTGDLELAEDAAAAFAAAVRTWRSSGVPDSPEAWLRVSSRNQALNALKRNARTVSVAPESLAELEHRAETPETMDDRLALLFVCAHPAIDRRMHAPLMLQTVVGVDAARIASVFLVPPATMGQRLSRAKAKIRDAGIRFHGPDANEFAARVDSVLLAVYATYGLADPIAETAADRDAGLRAEALRLADLLTELLPQQAETWGLSALLRHTESRRPARFVGGRFTPLAVQDTSLWSADDRRRGDQDLRRASALGAIGRFQLEAAISAVHSSRADGTPTDWGVISTLYLGPSVGATIGAASALLENGEPGGAQRLLDALPTDSVRDHQPYWVCRARVAQATHDLPAAIAAHDIAIGLTSDPAVRAYLIGTRAS